MSKRKIVDTGAWRDDYVQGLDPSEKLLFWYGITSPDINLCGIYQTPLKIIAVDTGIDKDMLPKIFKRFERDKKMKYSKGWLAIKNYMKHQSYNPNMLTAMNVELDAAPKSLVQWVLNPSERIPKGLKNPSRTTLINNNSNNNNNKECSELCELLKTLILRNKPDFIIGNINKWHVDADRIFRIDKRNLGEAKRVLTWALNDDFWHTNILSIGKFRKQYDKLDMQSRKGGRSTLRPAVSVGNKYDGVENRT